MGRSADSRPPVAAPINQNGAESTKTREKYRSGDLTGDAAGVSTSTASFALTGADTSLRA